jgi:predicted O-methyltransferase YrrM
MVREKPIIQLLFETDESRFFDNLDCYCTSWIDTCAILTLLRRHRPKSFLEVGTHRGHTARAVAERFPDMSLLLVDPGDSVAVSERGFQTSEYLPQDRIGELAKGMENVSICLARFRSVDWHNRQFEAIFIDGNHSYDEVYQDSLQAISLITRPGIVLWHDYGNIGEVTMALNDLSVDIVAVTGTHVAYWSTYRE